MNIKNSTENLALILIGITFGIYIGHRVSVKTAERMLEVQRSTIEKAIDKESIKNEIKNEIVIDKIKKSDSLTIIMKPENNQEPVNVVETKKDSVAPEEKKGFFKRIFGGKKKNKKD